MSMSKLPIRWRLHAPLALLVVVLSHMLAVWALPRVIMDRVISLGDREALTQNSETGVYLPPPTDHTQRRIVMPSPDLLYATCAYDVGERPLRVTLDINYPRYWSIALYASTSDNFFVVNDRDAAGAAVEFILQGPNAQASARGTSENLGTVIRSPTDRGFLLMRVLVNDDPAVRASAETARRQLRCQSL
jgi:uncharacterized membrane protein